jgi:uncharacterized alpha-E superfamily protein
MLSRIAESVYWMSRYLERVGNTARLVEINLIHLIEAEDVLPESAQWKPLLSIGNNEVAYATCYGGVPVTAERTIRFMTQERANPSSIRSSLRAARESARVVRDRISKEMWEAINEMWLDLNRALDGTVSPKHSPALYAEVRRGVARYHGLTSSTMMRGEAFGFYLLGTVLERADMSARILDVKYHLLLPDVSMVGSPLDYYQWAALLKSLSGFEAYRRRYHAGLRPVDVAEFAIFEPDFPRSLRFCVEQMEEALGEIGLSEGRCKIAVSDLRALLESGSAEHVFSSGLHEFLRQFLDLIAALNDALVAEYFDADVERQPCAT